MQIGKVAEQTGLSVDAIRFYEKQQLLDHPPRTEGGFRLFTTYDIQRIQFIRSAQQLGFSLPEVLELLVLQRGEEETCPHVRDLLKAKIAAIRSKIDELTALHSQLVRNLRKCDRKLKTSGGLRQCSCPVIEEIERDGHGGETKRG